MRVTEKLAFSTGVIAAAAGFWMFQTNGLMSWLLLTAAILFGILSVFFWVVAFTVAFGRVRQTAGAQRHNVVDSRDTRLVSADGLLHNYRPVKGARRK